MFNGFTWRAVIIYQECLCNVFIGKRFLTFFVRATVARRENLRSLRFLEENSSLNWHYSVLFCIFRWTSVMARSAKRKLHESILNNI